jgi:hypothetical protein
MNLMDEFLAIVDALEAQGIDYAIVGALALAVHGVPRATTDIDLMLRPQDIDRALDSVKGLGYTLPAQRMTFASGVTVQRVTKVHEEDALTLDLLVAQGPLERAWGSRVVVDASGRHLRVVSRRALVEMKALAGRLSDLADIQRLQGEDDNG